MDCVQIVDENNCLEKCRECVCNTFIIEGQNIVCARCGAFHKLISQEAIAKGEMVEEMFKNAKRRKPHCFFPSCGIEGKLCPDCAMS